MAPRGFPVGGYPSDYAKFWGVWIVLAAVTFLFVRAGRRRPGGPGAVRLVAGNLLVLLSLGWTAVVAGETYLRYVYDQTDSYGLTLTNVNWFGRHMNVNRFGFRDREFDRPPAPGAARVACVGDSFTQGWGIDDAEDCWPQRVNAELAVRAPGRFEVVNYGIVGMSTADELELVEGLANAGGIARVIVGYCLNDADDLAPPGARFERNDAPRIPWFDPTVSYVADFLWYRVKLRDDPRVRGYFGWVGDQYADEKIMARHEAQFRRMKAVCDAARMRLDVVVFPLFADWGPVYRFDAAHERVARMWRSVGVEVLDLREAYRGIPGPELVVNRNDGHPNERALEIASRVIVERLFPSAR